MKIKHLHASINDINGNLYFEIKGQLVIMFVGTPKFNNSGEWILYEYKILDESSENHKMLDLKPYDIENIKISKKEYKKLCEFSDNLNIKEYPEYENNMLRMVKEGDEYFILFEDKRMSLDQWEDRKKISDNYGLYNILIPILKGTMDSYSQ